MIVTEIQDLDFKKSLPVIFNFTVGILQDLEIKLIGNFTGQIVHSKLTKTRSKNDIQIYLFKLGYPLVDLIDSFDS